MPASYRLHPQGVSTSWRPPEEPRPLRLCWGPAHANLFGVIGVLVALLSLFLVVTSASDLMSGGGKTEPSVLIGMVVFFSSTFLLGAWFARRMLRKPARSAFEIEQAVLALAAAHAGRFTLAEVSTGCRLSVADARFALQRLCGQGVADLHMTDTGVEVYAFAGFLDAAAKAGARDLLEG